MSKSVTEIVNNNFKYIVSVRFEKVNKAYSFGTDDENMKEGDKVIVETQRGLELGYVISGLRDPEEHQINIPLKPVLRLATDRDFKDYQKNIEDEKEAMLICANEISKYNLEMHLISCEYTLDRAKITFVYIADERVDFRELLKTLAQIFHTRIDLRQIGARDKAKIVGGIGVCGRKLCCLHKSNFDVISINLAKNQLLALNISKLSGQCGKLKCCLKYENDIYTELREGLPKINAHVNYDGVNYRIHSMNVLSDTCKLDNREGAIYPALSQVVANGKFKVPLKPTAANKINTTENKDELVNTEVKTNNENRKKKNDKQQDKKDVVNREKGQYKGNKKKKNKPEYKSENKQGNKQNRNDNNKNYNKKNKVDNNGQKVITSEKKVFISKKQKQANDASKGE
jgi:cell fate regulator YaaT (PSP1 superfamily)